MALQGSSPLDTPCVALFYQQACALSYCWVMFNGNPEFLCKFSLGECPQPVMYETARIVFLQTQMQDHPVVLPLGLPVAKQSRGKATLLFSTPLFQQFQTFESMSHSMFQLNQGKFEETDYEGPLRLQPASAALVRGLTALGVRLTLDLTLSLLHSATRPDQPDAGLTQAGGHGVPPRVGSSGGGSGSGSGSAVRRRQLRALSVACLGGADALGPAMAESAQAALFQTFRHLHAAYPVVDSAACSVRSELPVRVGLQPPPSNKESQRIPLLRPMG